MVEVFGPESPGYREDTPPLDLEIRWKNRLINFLPRWHGFLFVDTPCIELHIFADASNSAFGTVAFFRYKNKTQ